MVELERIDVFFCCTTRILEVYYEKQKSSGRNIFAVYYLSGITKNGVYQLALIPEDQLENKLKEFPHPSFYIYALSSKPIIVC